MSSLSIPEQMRNAWRMGYTATIRGWQTLDDLKLQAIQENGIADAYRMGVEWARKEKACIAEQRKGAL